MAPRALLAAALLSAASVQAAPAPPLPKAHFSTPLHGAVRRPASKAAALKAITGKAAGHNRGASPGASTTTTLAGVALDQEYVANITVGGQQFAVIVDTGSSDTWLVQRGFNCIGLDSAQSRAVCAFGPAFDPSRSKTFQAVPNENFNTSFGDLEFINGPVGKDTVSVGGMTVTQQTIGLASLAAWEGDGITSGILGLANPDLTKAYLGTDFSADSHDNKAIYDPVFHNAVKQGVVPQPYFSVALDRPSFAAQIKSTYDSPLGHIAFGGIAPVPTVGPSANVPVQTRTVDLNNATVAAYLWYLVNVDAYQFPGAPAGATGNAIIDTGTALNYLPSAVAAAYNAQFNPPATLDADSGMYFVDCKAKPPPFAVKLGGQTFPISPVDMIVPFGADANGTTLCISGNQDGGPPEDGAIFVLGDTFLHNVVATFNVKTNTVTITQRAPY